MTSEQNRAEKYLGTGLREDIVQDGTLKKKQTDRTKKEAKQVVESSLDRD